MTSRPWKKISEEIVSSTPYWAHAKTMFEHPNGKHYVFEWVKAGGFVAVVAIDEAGKLVLVQQFRPLVDAVSLEFPMGGIKEGQTPLVAAQAEFAEEAGLGAEVWENAGKCFALIGSSNKAMHLFIARDLYPEQAQPDETEEFEQVRMTVEEFESAVQKGEIICGPSLAAWALARPRVLAIIDQLRSGR